MKIYTLGYSGWSVEAIKTFLESVNGVAFEEGGMATLFVAM